jgi:hypothetical protein
LILIQPLQIYYKYNLINNEPFMLYGVCVLLYTKNQVVKGCMWNRLFELI